MTVSHVVSGSGLSAGPIAGICFGVVLLIAVFVGVHKCKPSIVIFLSFMCNTT